MKNVIVVILFFSIIILSGCNRENPVNSQNGINSNLVNNTTKEYHAHFKVYQNTVYNPDVWNLLYDNDCNFAKWQSAGQTVPAGSIDIDPNGGYSLKFEESASWNTTTMTEDLQVFYVFMEPGTYGTEVIKYPLNINFSRDQNSLGCVSNTAVVDVSEIVTGRAPSYTKEFAFSLRSDTHYLLPGYIGNLKIGITDNNNQTPMTLFEKDVFSQSSYTSPIYTVHSKDLINLKSYTINSTGYIQHRHKTITNEDNVYYKIFNKNGYAEDTYYFTSATTLGNNGYQWYSYYFDNPNSNLNQFLQNNKDEELNIQIIITAEN
jgi:hypothetical protein